MYVISMRKIHLDFVGATSGRPSFRVCKNADLRYARSPASGAVCRRQAAQTGIGGGFRLCGRSCSTSADPLTCAASRARPDAGREVCASPPKGGRISYRIDLFPCATVSKPPLCKGRWRGALRKTATEGLFRRELIISNPSVSSADRADCRCRGIFMCNTKGTAFSGSPFFVLILPTLSDVSQNGKVGGF